MYIDRLVTNGWKKPNQVDITFGPGLNGVVGANYTGKSSLLWAIIYALGGVSALPSGYTLETQGSPAKFKVELWFMGKYYVLRTKSKVELYEVSNMDKPIAEGTSVVNRRIELILGMKVKRFLDLRMGRQKMIHNILKMGGTDLFKIVQELSGVDDVDKAITLTADRAKKTEGALEVIPEVPAEAVEAAIKSRDESLETLDDIRDRLLVKEDQLQTVSKALTLLNENLVKSTAQWTRYESLKAQYEDWKREQEKRSSAVLSADERLAKALANFPDGLDAALDRQRELKELRLQFSGDKAALKAARQALEDLDTALVRAQRRVGGVEGKTPEGVESHAAALRKSLEDLAAERSPELPSTEQEAEFKSRVEALKASIVTYIHDIQAKKKSLTDGICSQCHRPFEGHTEEHVEEVKAAIEVLEQRKNGAYDQKAELEKIAQQWEEGKQRVKARSGRQAELASALCTIELRLKEYREEEERIRLASVQTAQLIESLQEKVDKQTDVSEESLDLDNKLESVHWATEEVSRARQALELLGAAAVQEPEEPELASPAQFKAYIAEQKTLAEQLRTDLEKLNAQKATCNTSIASAQKLIADASARQEERQGILQRQQVELSLLKYLRSSRDRFSRASWTQFLARASQFVAQTTEGRVTDLDRDEKGNFRYYEGGAWFGVANASGAQENLISLGIQMALADVSSCPLNVLLADEPTDSMEEEHSSAALMALASCGRQVIVVTHKELDRSLFSHVYELKRSS